MSTFNPSPTIGYTFGSGGTSGGTTTTGSSGSGFGNFFKSSAGQNIISQGVGSLLSLYI